MAKNKMVLNNYAYEIELVYINEKTNKSTALMPEQIKSIIIDRDYDKNNMPMIFANLALDRKTIDDLVKNYERDTIVLRIYKKVDGDMPLKEKVLEHKCIFFINKDINYLDKLQYSGDEDTHDKYIVLTIGLMSLDIINKNKALMIGTSISGTTNDIIRYYTKNINLVMEKLDYNASFNKQVVQSVNSISELISYLNSLKVLYKTSYRFFMDFDRSYLVSSANKEVPANGETITSVLIVVEDVLKNMKEQEGMYTNKEQKNYQINVPSIDTDLKRNRLLEKNYTSLTATTTSGNTSNKDLSVNKAIYSGDKKSIIRINNDNTNMLSNIQGDMDSAAVTFVMDKEGLDTSVLNINKRYVIKNFDAHSDLDGDFLLARKVDIFTRDDKEFTLNTILSFRIKP